jgi:flagellar biosynthesis/type III secretory pathway chaperone
MKDILNKMIVDEIEAIKHLLNELEIQYKCIMKNDVFAMEECVSKIKMVNKEVAVLEMEKRKIIGERSIREVIYEIEDEDLMINYRKIRKLLEEVKLQKDTNEILLKQGLSYTNQMLNIINPGSKSLNMYNSYGKVKR